MATCASAAPAGAVVGGEPLDSTGRAVVHVRVRLRRDARRSPTACSPPRTASAAIAPERDGADRRQRRAAHGHACRPAPRLPPQERRELPRRRRDRAARPAGHGRRPGHARPTSREQRPHHRLRQHLRPGHRPQRGRDAQGRPAPGHAAPGQRRRLRQGLQDQPPRHRRALQRRPDALRGRRRRQAAAQLRLLRRQRRRAGRRHQRGAGPARRRQLGRGPLRRGPFAVGVRRRGPLPRLHPRPDPDLGPDAALRR